MRQVEIPGGTALLREREDLRGRDRNLIEAATVAAQSAIEKLPRTIIECGDLEGMEPEELAKRLNEELDGISFSFEEGMALAKLREVTVIALLADWSRPEKLPTLETIGDLPDELYQALQVAIGGVQNIANPTDFEPGANLKDRPTGSSESSDTHSARTDQGAENHSTPASLPTGESTATEASIPA